MDKEQVSHSELVQLCAVDTELFGKTFFPRAFRQSSPGFAPEVWAALEGPREYVNLLMFRGASKTTRVRTYIVKRVVYAISRTILLVAQSEAKAASSVRWIKRAVEFNKPLLETFGVRRGSKWTDTEIEIVHGVEEVSVNIIGYGYTGPIRGINFDDFRPDLAVIDDILNEENSATPDQREKVKDLVYGAIDNGRAPRSEAPDSKIVVLQTPQNREDFSYEASKDPATWLTVEVPCWTRSTIDLPDERKESVWGARWTSDVLRRRKASYIRRNQLSIWMREFECKVIAPELNAFIPDWLGEYDVLPSGLTHVLAIDPVPPPSEKALKTGLKHNDFESLAVVGKWKGTFYVREIAVNRGHDPSWTISEFFRLILKYRINRVLVETVAYQRVLKWLLEKAMKERKRYVNIVGFQGSGSKYQRILDALSEPGSEGKILLPGASTPMGLSPGMQMFRSQFADYPNVNHDDCLESVAVAIGDLSSSLAYADGDAANDDEAGDEEEEAEPLEYAAGVLCP